MKSFFTRSLPFRCHACWLSLLVLSVAHSSVLAGDLSVTGDLGVTGILDVNGNTFNFGSWSNDSSKFGLGITYAEDSGNSATVTLTTTRPSSGWLWQQAAPNNGTGSVPQMFLTPGNALVLYNQAVHRTPQIVLDPVGTSSFGTSIMFNGANNKMPNQTVSDNSSVLTVGLADARYLVQPVGSSLSLGTSASASGQNATALGAYSNASGQDSTALSFDSQATGGYTAALGFGSRATGSLAVSLGANSAATGDAASSLGDYSVASGFGSTSIGTSSSATGQVATALGAYSSASGDLSLTLGHGSSASAKDASALGVYSQATQPDSTALGYSSHATGGVASALGAYSTASGYSSVAVALSSLASGYGSMALGQNSQAIGQYSTSIGNTHATSLFQCTLGCYNVSGGDAMNWVPTDDLLTVGNGQDAAHPSNALSVKKNGDTTVAGNLNVVKAIIVQPQGDLSMGEFTAQPSPSPTP